MPYPDGLFWTIKQSPDSIEADLERATASYRAANLPLRDYGTLANAFNNGSFHPATATFEVQWHMLPAAGPKPRKIRDATQGYAGDFWDVNGNAAAGAATLVWSAAEAGFQFTSDAATSSTSYFAELGHERNGVFFK